MSELIEAHLRYLRAGGYSPNTVSSRVRLLRDADSWLPYGLDAASDDELVEYLGWEGWSRWTRNTYWKHLHGYYTWAVRAGHLDLDPMADLHRPPNGEATPDPVTDDELAYALAHSPDQPWRTAVMLAAYAGLRGCEIVRLHRHDVTAETVRIVGGKGGRDAFVPTHAELWESVRTRREGLLVRSATGKVLSPHDLTGRQRHHWRRIGMPDVHLHRFRHWYGTTLLKAGADLRTVQELMRHKSIISTQNYTKVVDEQRRLAIRSLPVPHPASRFSAEHTAA